MSRASGGVAVALGPEAAMALWTDPRRWHTFVEGFERVVEADAEWPDTGAELVWQSIPTGRGRVTERVLESDLGRVFSTRVQEERLTGVQEARFSAAGEDSTEVAVVLDYVLTRGGLLGRLTDALFIRRALTDALRRTLERFAIEADEEGAVREDVG